MEMEGLRRLRVDDDRLDVLRREVDLRLRLLVDDVLRFLLVLFVRRLVVELR